VSDLAEGLSPETEEVLRRVRQGERMPQARKRRLKGAVLARIAVASTAALAAGQGAATAMGAGFIAKAVVGIALVGSVGAGSYLALRPARHPAAATLHPPRVVAAAPPRVAPPAPPPFVEPATEPPAPAPAPAKAAPRTHRTAARHDAPDESSTLGAETALLREADRALRAGDAATALARLDEHATRFPRGVLAPERSAERLIVLCQLGVADPRAVMQFLAARSGSPLAARVRRACVPQP
jgi:hypothetical protein